MHGIGVRTPIAAEVAEATVGFERDKYVPKATIFTIGIWSMMFASGGHVREHLVFPPIPSGTTEIVTVPEYSAVRNLRAAENTPLRCRGERSN
jgi:hypothetical protein